MRHNGRIYELHMDVQKLRLKYFKSSTRRLLQMCYSAQPTIPKLHRLAGLNSRDVCLTAL